MNSNKLHKIQDKLFDIFIIISYLTYALILLGITTTKPKYLVYMDTIVQAYISLFLIIRFNPYRNILFTELDRKICFSAGLFLFTTTAINRIMINYFDNIAAFIKNLFGIENKKSIPDEIGTPGIGEIIGGLIKR
jgi:hypothetical protein